MFKLERGKESRLGIVSIAIVMIGSFFANASAGMGNASEWNFFVSIGYIVYWFMYPKLFDDNRILMKIAYIISNLTLVFALCSMVCILAGSEGVVYGLYFSLSQIGLITTVPFYGLKFLLNEYYNSSVIYYSGITLFILLWVLYMRYQMKKHHYVK